MPYVTINSEALSLSYYDRDIQTWHKVPQKPFKVNVNTQFQYNDKIYRFRNGNWVGNGQENYTPELVDGTLWFTNDFKANNMVEYCKAKGNRNRRRTAMQFSRM